MKKLEAYAKYFVTRGTCTDARGATCNGGNGGRGARKTDDNSRVRNKPIKGGGS